MKTNSREILIYYNPEASLDRKTVAYAQSMDAKVRVYSHENSPSTTTSWKMILDALELHPKKIMNKALPKYQNNFRGKEFDEEGWINVLKHNPDLIKAPIAIRGSKVILCNSPTDIYQL